MEFIVLAAIVLLFLFRKPPSERRNRAFVQQTPEFTMKVVNRQMKIVVAIFLLPIVFLLVENGISGGTADKNGDILWIYLPLIPLCTIALINMQLRKRNIIKRAKEEAER